MNLTINVSQTLEPSAKQALMAFNNYKAKAYKGLMKRLKKASKEPLVKATLKINAKAEALLSVIMRSLHFVEKTRAFKALTHLSVIVVESVKRDGLKLTTLLTMLGYVGWCANNIL